MCTCVKRVNKELEKFNTILDEVTMLNFATGKCRQSLQITSTKLTRQKGKSKIVLATFCPFCGKRSAPKPSRSRS